MFNWLCAMLQMTLTPLQGEQSCHTLSVWLYARRHLSVFIRSILFYVLTYVVLVCKCTITNFKFPLIYKRVRSRLQELRLYPAPMCVSANIRDFFTPVTN